MYLVINLAVIDMFVAGNTVYYLVYIPGTFCSLWNWNSTAVGINIFRTVLMMLLAFGSLVNIAIIALERMHATFFPFKHRVLKKWVYLLLIAVVWVTPGLEAIAYVLLTQFEETAYNGLYLHAAFILFCLVIICVSYTSIVINVRCGVKPHHHVANSRERKLTMTLLIVTVVSLVLYLPRVIWGICVIAISKHEISQFLSSSVAYYLDHALLFLLYANSLVNPILYAIRMPEYRSALLALLRKRPQQQRQVAVFPLRDM